MTRAWSTYRAGTLLAEEKMAARDLADMPVNWRISTELFPNGWVRWAKGEF